MRLQQELVEQVDDTDDTVNYSLPLLLSSTMPYQVANVDNDSLRKDDFFSSIDNRKGISERLFNVFRATKRPFQAGSLKRNFLTLLLFQVGLYWTGWFFVYSMISMVTQSKAPGNVLSFIILPVAFIALYIKMHIKDRTLPLIKQKKQEIAYIKYEEEHKNTFHLINNIHVEDNLPIDPFLYIAAKKVGKERPNQNDQVILETPLKIKKFRLTSRKMGDLKQQDLLNITNSYVRVYHQIRIVPKNVNILNLMRDQVRSTIFYWQQSSPQNQYHFKLSFESKIFAKINQLQGMAIVQSNLYLYITKVQFVMILLQVIIPPFMLVNQIYFRIRNWFKFITIVHEFQVDQASNS